MTDDLTKGPQPATPASAFDLRTLAKSVDEASARIEKDRLAQEERIAASIHKMRWQRRFAFIGVIAGVIGIIGSVVAGVGIHRNNEIFQQARVTTCISYNEDIAANVNALNDRTQDLLRLAAARSTHPTPEQQALLQGQIDAYEKIKVPARDCSPDGIARFFHED